jgi:DNA-binding SARP family transcriptional activator
VASGTATGAAGTTVRVLGPVAATVAGRACTPTSPTMRALLGLLASDAGRVVPVDRVIAELWGEDADPSRTSSVHVYVSRLRRTLGDADSEPGGPPPPVRVLRRPPGYVLELPDGALDAELLSRLSAAAHNRVASDPAAVLTMLDEALALVAGEPLADVVDLLGPWAAGQARRLQELVLTTRESRVEALLGVGRASDAVAEAGQLLRADPLRESVLALRLLGLYRSGRQAEALASYDAFRRRLADDLGVDPGPRLRLLHAQLLDQDPGLDLPEPPRSTAQVPPQLRRGLRSLAAGRRAADVATVEAALERTRLGAGEVWLVSGEAGIGKTHLTQVVLERARALGMAVAQGRAQEVARDTPYWLWTRVLQRLPDLPRTAEVDVVLGAGAADSGRPLTRPAVHEAVARLLVDEAVAGRPLLLVLEDLHWGDEPSLQLLARISELATAAPLLVLGTWRVEDAAPAGAIGALLAHLARTPGTSRLALSGLDASEARGLLTDELGWQPDEATVAAAVDRTGGNPFFLQELARSVREAPQPDEAWLTLPTTVRDVLLHRVAGLPEAARRVLDVAAVHGRECELAQLEAVAGLPGEELDVGVAAAGQSGLVHEVSSARPALRFRHALVREALESRLGARARMRLHAGAGAALSRRPDADVDQLAFHLLAGGDLTDAVTTLQAALAAVDRAMAQLAHEHAHSLLERAFIVLPRVPQGAQRDRLELALQTRLGTHVATRYGFAAPGAQAALDRCQHLALRVDPSPDVDAALYRRFLWLLMGGDYPGVRDFAEAVLQHADRLTGVARDRIRLLGHLARGSVLWCLGEAEPAVAELQQARRLADDAGIGHAVAAFGDPAVRVRMFLCHALASAGRPEEAAAVADQMVGLARQSGPADESDALATRGMMYAAFGDPERALADGVEGRRLGGRAGAELLGHFGALNEGWGRALSGDGETGAQLARVAAEGYRATGTRMHDPLVFTMLAEVEAAAGHRERAVAAAEAGLAALRRAHSRLWRDRLVAAAGLRTPVVQPASSPGQPGGKPSPAGSGH